MIRQSEQEPPFKAKKPSSDIWSIRGVSDETKRRVKIAALQAGMPVGEYVEKTLLKIVDAELPPLNLQPQATRTHKRGH